MRFDRGAINDYDLSVLIAERSTTIGD
jgi:hypothetical protein